MFRSNYWNLIHFIIHLILIVLHHYQLKKIKNNYLINQFDFLNMFMNICYSHRPKEDAF